MPPVQQLEDAGEIESLGRLGHRSPKLAVEVGSLGWQERSADRAGVGTWWRLLAMEVGGDTHTAMLPT